MPWSLVKIPNKFVGTVSPEADDLYAGAVLSPVNLEINYNLVAFVFYKISLYVLVTMWPFLTESSATSST